MIRTLALSLLAALVAPICSAQNEAPPEQPPDEPPAPGKEAPPPAMLRGWILPGDHKEKISLGLHSVADEQPKTVAASTAGERQVATDYQPVVGATNYQLVLSVGDKPVATQSAPLKPNQAYTAAAWPEAAGWQLKLLPDGPTAPDAMDRPLRILSLAGGRDTILKAGNRDNVKIPSGGFTELRLPPKVAPLDVTVLATDGGPPSQASMEVDLSAMPSAYILISPDYRGRILPRAIEGGAPPALAEEPASPASPVLSPEKLAALAKTNKLQQLRSDLQAAKDMLSVIEARAKGPNPLPNAAQLKANMEKSIIDLQRQIGSGAAPVPTTP